MQGTVFVSFSSFTSTLKLKTHSQLTQSPFMGTDCLFIVVNTSCSGICFAIYAWQKFFHNPLAPNGSRALFEFLPGINSETNALTLGIYSYNKLENYYFVQLSTANLGFLLFLPYSCN